MLENIADAVSLFLTFENISIVFVGVLIGTVIGAIPGMTTPMGVALALPFTFTMEPVTGILLLLGIYKGGAVRRIDHRNINQGARYTGSFVHSA